LTIVLVEFASQTEVRDFGYKARAYKQISGRDIAVNDSFVVKIREPRCGSVRELDTEKTK
jgi:hypothetical protein